MHRRYLVTNFKVPHWETVGKTVEATTSRRTTAATTTDGRAHHTQDHSPNYSQNKTVTAASRDISSALFKAAIFH